MLLFWSVAVTPCQDDCIFPASPSPPPYKKNKKPKRKQTKKKTPNKNTHYGPVYSSWVRKRILRPDGNAWGGGGGGRRTLHVPCWSFSQSIRGIPDNRLLLWARILHALMTAQRMGGSPSHVWTGALRNCPQADDGTKLAHGYRWICFCWDGRFSDSQPLCCGTLVCHERSSSMCRWNHSISHGCSGNDLFTSDKIIDLFVIYPVAVLAPSTDPFL